MDRMLKNFTYTLCVILAVAMLMFAGMMIWISSSKQEQRAYQPQGGTGVDLTALVNETDKPSIYSMCKVAECGKAALEITSERELAYVIKNVQNGGGGCF